MLVGPFLSARIKPTLFLISCLSLSALLYRFFPKDKTRDAVMSSLESIVVPATDKHTATVIFLHGLGDTGNGWAPVARMLSKVPALNHIKWILPHAPKKPVTLNFGMTMNSWFDIYGLSDDSPEDESGILASTKSIKDIITTEINSGISSGRILVGGFSQGGAIGLLTALTEDRKLAGLVVLSAWAPLASKLQELMQPQAVDLPIFWGHGTADPVVSYKWGSKSVEFLQQRLRIPKAAEGNPAGIRFNSYPGLAHSADPKEINDLSEFLKAVVPKDS